MEYFDVQLRQKVRVGIPARQIVEVLNFKTHEICPVTGVHPLLLGVITWRSKLLWSLNLSDVLQLKAEAAHPGPQAAASDRDDVAALVVSAASVETGPERHLVCVVSALKGIIEVPAHQVQPIASTLPAVLRQFFQGIARQETPLLLLDTQRLLEVNRWQDISHSR